MAQAVWDASRSLKSFVASATLALSDTGTPAQAASAMTVSAEARRRVSSRGPRDAFYILLPLIVVMSTFLFLMLVFLLCVLLLRRRRGIALRDSDGPVDVSREDLIQGEGGFEGVEERWLETVSEQERREYLRAKTWQSQYPPNSQPTDITLSQFLSIQEKGVSAWSFEPDYETISSVLVHARTEITFLPDPESSSCVQSNLPLPKLNEVYYWEVKCFDLPTSTNIAVGLATKPYPPFRLPGHCRHSVAYHSNGDKSFNWPFTSSTFFAPLKEGDVLGLGYRPRSGTVFYTRNGRKTEDAFVGLNRWNLFPTVGADGPCSLHVNLGQSGFVFIEANVKKWGLAPSVGTLAPPPAYGSERGSILLAAGGNIQSADDSAVVGSPPGPSSHGSRSSRRHRTRRPKPTQPSSSTAPVASSPLRTSSLASTQPVPRSPPPPITPIDEEMEDSSGAGPSSSSSRYLSPTDMPYHTPANARLPSSPIADTPPVEEEVETAEERDGVQSPQSPSGSSSRSSSPSPPPPADTDGAGAGYFNMTRRRAHSSTTSSNPFLHSRTHNRSRSEAIPAAIPVHHGALPDTPLSPNPPTPNAHDIDLGAWTPRRPGSSTIRDRLSGASAISRSAAADPPPPSYSPLDPYAYADGVRIDLPASVIAAAMEGAGIPESAIGASNTRAERRSRREGRSGR